MKTSKYQSTKQQWLNGQLLKKGDPVFLTERQAKELAPPYGNAVSIAQEATKEIEKKEVIDDKLDGDKRKSRSAVR